MRFYIFIELEAVIFKVFVAIDSLPEAVEPICRSYSKDKLLKGIASELHYLVAFILITHSEWQMEMRLILGSIFE